MLKLTSTYTSLVVAACLLGAACVNAVPRPSESPSSTSSAPDATPTVPYATDDPNVPLWNPNSKMIPEAIRGTFGANILGPQNIPLELQNPSLLAPPTTDHGDV